MKFCARARRFKLHKLAEYLYIYAPIKDFYTISLGFKLNV